MITAVSLAPNISASQPVSTAGRAERERHQHPVEREDATADVVGNDLLQPIGREHPLGRLRRCARAPPREAPGAGSDTMPSSAYPAPNTAKRHADGEEQAAVLVPERGPSDERPDQRAEPSARPGAARCPASPAWNRPSREQRDEDEHAAGEAPSELHGEQRQHPVVRAARSGASPSPPRPSGSGFSAPRASWNERWIRTRSNADPANESGVDDDGGVASEDGGDRRRRPPPRPPASCPTASPTARSPSRGPPPRPGWGAPRPTPARTRR